ncbi:MAG: CehA/McbA family metallohydrolase, partial [Gemmatimonadaceae bacterium]
MAAMALRRLIVATLAFGASTPIDLAAQRKPVLPAMTLPHPYYVRELYLPQLTTGPSAVTWSPTGDEVVYSMRGTLWRQRVNSDTAVQLTDGNGYDYQPDWSRGGRFIAFVTRVPEHVQLRVLDLQTDQPTTLIMQGIAVEPRWSPAGDRLAWVEVGARAHVKIAPFAASRLGAPTHVTPEHDSALPRYYYGRWDHYLSPAWSPDGASMIVVSNRDRVWGTGGLWRVPLGTTAGTVARDAMRSVRDEETSWKARPDWAPDGRRVVWSSYAGRQWHQLWLTTAEGGEPFQLTYGEFDATGARWSPDGRRIAYISNERGTTSLWILDVPGGSRREIVARHRRFLAPEGKLRIVATDAATGRSIPARVSVRGIAARYYGPDDGWLHAADGFDRDERRFEFTYFHADSAATVTLPAGDATIEAMRGIEYEPVVRRVSVRSGVTTTVRVPLRRLDDPASRGWISGDLHVHMNYGGTYRNTPARLVRQARAEGLRVVENLIVNKESRIPDIGYFSGAPDPASTPDVLLKHDEEFHTSFWGHTGLLGLSQHVVLPNYAGYANTAAASLFPSNSQVLETARAQGGITGYVHPFDAWPQPDDLTRPLTNAFPVDLALGLVDYYEALGFVDDFMPTQRVWYSALNCGFRLAVGAGTDAMANYASLRGPVGMNRVYARVRGPLTHRAFLDAIKAGRTFATNAPLLELTIGGRGPGDELRLPAGRRQLGAQIRMRSMVPIDHLEIVHNGQAIRTIDTSADGRRADAIVDFEVTGSGWYLLRAWSERARHPVLDLYPMGTTSPIYVTMNDAPVRSTADGRYFIAWIDRLLS